MVVVVASDVAALAVCDRARLAAERIPDRLAAAVLGDSAFDLVGRGGDTPAEVTRKARNRAKRGAAHLAPLLRFNRLRSVYIPGSADLRLASTWAAGITRVRSAPGAKACANGPGTRPSRVA